MASWGANGRMRNGFFKMPANSNKTSSLAMHFRPVYPMVNPNPALPASKEIHVTVLINVLIRLLNHHTPPVVHWHRGEENEGDAFFWFIRDREQVQKALRSDPEFVRLCKKYKSSTKTSNSYSTNFPELWMLHQELIADQFRLLSASEQLRVSALGVTAYKHPWFQMFSHHLWKKIGLQRLPDSAPSADSSLPSATVSLPQAAPPPPPPPTGEGKEGEEPKATPASAQLPEGQLPQPMSPQTVPSTPPPSQPPIVPYFPIFSFTSSAFASASSSSTSSTKQKPPLWRRSKQEEKEKKALSDMEDTVRYHDICMHRVFEKLAALETAVRALNNNQELLPDLSYALHSQSETVARSTAINWQHLDDSIDET